MDKSTLRKKLLAARSGIINRAEKDVCIVKTLANYLSKCDNIFVYVSIGSEVNTHNIIQDFISTKKIFVPYTDENKTMYVAEPVTPVDFDSVDKHGNVAVLPGKYYNSRVETAVVPLAGFNKDCFRIGYGAGCYDKYFAEHPHVFKIGLAYDEQESEFVPVDTDVPMDIIITPRRIIRRK